MSARLFSWVLCLLVFVSGRISADDKAGVLTQQEQDLVRQAVWGTPDAKTKALDELRRWAVIPERVRQVEEIIKAGRTYGPVDGKRQTLAVPIDSQRKVNLFVQIPPGYDPTRRYPLMIAIGGGPPPSGERSTAAAKSMLAVWSKPADQAGWIVAAVEDTVSVRLPGKELRYFILHADHLRSIRDSLLEKYAIDPNRVHVTGISLGSNYALAYAAAHPDWFAGIAPVSTEGESREHVLRNLRHVGVYVLEGAKDKNIRTIDGPRKLAEILKQFDYPHRYEEDANRGHEGFVEKYPQVLKWLTERPRPPFPKEIIRLPHAGIVLPGKRFYWLEAGTHQAAVAARVDGNTLAVQAARVGRLTFHLSDRLLDLSAPVVIRVNGQVVHDKVIQRSLVTAVEDATLLNDTARFATARITVEVPDLAAGEKWLTTLAPKVEPSRLPFWEDFALTTLKEKRVSFLAELEPTKAASGLPPGHTALRVKSAPDGSPLRSGDLLLELNSEPLFAGADSISFLHDFLLRTTEKTVALKIVRDGKAQQEKIDVQKNNDQGDKPVKVQPDKAVSGDKERKIVVQEDVVYGRVQGAGLLADIAYPEGKGPFPVILSVHGGRWFRESKNTHSAIKVRQWAGLGFFAMSIEYRLIGCTPAPACYQDVLCAVRWLHAHAAKYPIATDRIFLIGQSAGGHLVSLAATLGDGPFKRTGGWEDGANDFRAVICVSAPYELTKLDWGSGWTPAGEEPVAARKLASPIDHVSNKTKPILIIHSDDDKSVPVQQALDMVQALEKAKVRNRFVHFKDKGHISITDDVIKETRAFIVEITGKADEKKETR